MKIEFDGFVVMNLISARIQVERLSNTVDFTAQTKGFQAENIQINKS